MKPSTGSGSKQITRSGQTAGRHGANPSASVKGGQAPRDLTIKTKSE